jgi:predicted ferric reductase
MAKRLPRSEHARGFPAPALAALYAAATVVPLTLAAVSGIEPAGPWSEAATAVGMIGAVMLLLQLVSSGRFEMLSGRIGIDVTMAFHKWAARVMVVLILLHPILFVAPVSPDRLNVAFNHLAAMLDSPRNLSGVVGLVLIVAVVCLAMLRDRLTVPYEAWRASHGLLALAATFATVHHILGVGTYAGESRLRAFWLLLTLAAVAAALGVYTVRAWRIHHQTWRVIGVRPVAERLWEVTIGSASQRLAFKAGQFAWLALAPRRFPLFDHPFSIASSPREGDKLSFIVQEAGDFTDKVAALPLGTPAGLDAPHGSFTLDGIRADSVLLIAGGVGIAPILGLLRDLGANDDRRPVRLVYGARAPAAMIEPAELQSMLDRLNARAFFLVDTPSPDWANGIGPVTPAHLQEALAGLDPERVAAMICGPGAMMTAVTDGLHALGVPYPNIRYERFDYAAGAPSGKDRRVMAGFWVMALAIAAAGVAFALR